MDKFICNGKAPNSLSLVVAFMLALLTGCWVPSTNEVYVVSGDSIAAGATQSINNLLLRKDNAPIVVNNTVGGGLVKASAYTCGRLASLHQFTTPSVIIVIAGTNDALADTGTFPQDIDTQMSCIDPTTTVYWVPPYVSPEYTRYVEEAGERWVNLVVVPFSPTPPQLKNDGIHLNAAGNAALINALSAHL